MRVLLAVLLLCMPLAAYAGSADAIKAQQCAEVVRPILSGAQSRYRETPLVFEWMKVEQLKPLVMEKGWPTDRILIRDDGETMEQRVELQEKIGAGWHWADERIKRGEPPPDWNQEFVKRMKQCVQMTEGALEYHPAASGHPMLEQQCRTDAAMAQIVYDLMRIGKLSAGEAVKRVRQAEQNPTDEDTLLRFAADAVAYDLAKQGGAQQPPFIQFMYERCTGVRREI